MACFSPLGSPSANAAAVSWDDGGGADNNWSTNANWINNTTATNDVQPTSADDVSFVDLGRSASPTVTNIVDANRTINSLSYLNTGGSGTAHTTSISSNVTLTLAGTTGTAFNVGNASTTATTYTNITGPGALLINGGTGTSFAVATGTFTTTNITTTLDMSGLSSFTASVGGFNLGTGVRGAANVSLGTTNSITATTMALGGNTTTGGLTTNLNLGQTNTVNVTTFNIGGGRSTGSIQYRTGLTGATTIIRNAAGTGRAAANLGIGNISASGIGSGTMDFSGGSVDAMFSTVNMGTGATGTGSGSSTGTLTMGLGTIDATTINVGIGSGATGTANTGAGIINLNANAGNLIAGTVVLGSQTNAGGTVTANTTGTVNQNGGIATITTLTLGQRTATGTANVTATYNLAAGTLKAQTIQAGASNGSGAGTVTRTINWTGGTIQNLNSATDLTINSGTNMTLALTGNTTAFNAETNRTITSNIFTNGTGSLTKTGAGTLVLSGPGNAYSGGTTINGGTLNINSVWALGGGVYGGLTFGATGGTLQYATTLLNTATDITQDTSDGGLGVNGVQKTVTFTGNATINTNGNNVSYKFGVGNNGAGNLTKSGSGTLALNGTSTYTGSTTVSAGTLLVNGSLGNGAVTVSGSATLGGTGSIAGTVSIGGTASLSAGASIESLSSGNLSMTSGTTFVYEVLNNTSTGADLMAVNGTLSLTTVTLGLDSTSLTALASNSFLANDKITLISYKYNNSTEVTSGFTGYADDTAYNFGSNQWQFNYNDLVAGGNFGSDAIAASQDRFVTMTLVPEPGAALLGGLGVLTLLRRRRR